MPHQLESNYSKFLASSSPGGKSLGGLKVLQVYNNGSCNNNNVVDAFSNYVDEEDQLPDQSINDDQLAFRKAEEAASRRHQAAEWLRQMDRGASATLPKDPSEEQFRLALRNGLILCNVLNKVNPGSIGKVVKNPNLDVQSTEGAAHSAIQYFENMRNFLEALKNMKLLTFEASDVEKGGSSNKVVDCILCLKGYHEWRQSGGIGVWKYGGTVRITSFPKSSSSSLVGSESADESLDGSESSQYEQLLEFLHFSKSVSTEDSKIVNILTCIFDQFGLGLLRAYLTDTDDIEEVPVNAMVIDALLSKVVKDFSSLVVSQGTQLALLLNKIVNSERGSLSKHQFLETISQYLQRRTSFASNDFSNFCTCRGKEVTDRADIDRSRVHADQLFLQQKQVEEMKISNQKMKLEILQIHSNWEEELRRLGLHVNILEAGSSSYHRVLEENRQLYNQVQDLKGTIRVYCRVRPFLPGQSSKHSVVDYIGETGNIMVVNPTKQGKDARKVFTFNKVFGSDATQEQIYVDTRPLVRSILDGYNVCIFAYGQTGSGKTYTMSGPDLTSEDTWGVNYRALAELFNISKTRSDVIKYDVAVQMIEIYNEQVRDLLVSDGSGRRLDIKNSPQLNGLNVPDASLVPVTSTDDVLDLMRIGHKNRAVGATALNERSSRSHSVLTVHVQGKELCSGSILRGCLHLVDLAGSERVDKSEAVGERLKEAQYINRSLSALGDVISALAQKSAHIPYRNSKLTQVLQDSLGGQAKTLMFVHINPEANAYGETMSTLKFAERVASIELGAARFNKETGDIRELKDEISNLKLALERKEAELEQIKSAPSTRANTEHQKARAVSPFRTPKGCSKPENGQRVITEARSCSSGKQRRSRFPVALSDKEELKQTLFPSEDKIRSVSTDRGSIIKTRPADTQPIMPRFPFPARVPAQKSVAMSASAQDPPNDKLDVLSSLQNLNIKKGCPEQDDDLFKQALNVRQGGIRKIKGESKVGVMKHQMPVKIQMVDDDDDTANVQSSNADHGLRFQTPEWNSLLSKKPETKSQFTGVRNPKETATYPVPEFRRSKSTSRGNFIL